jgi:hypothetical protein
MTENSTDREVAQEWLKSLPGYRQLIKERIHVAQKRVIRADQDREKRQNIVEVDHLGREVEGCG